MQCIFVVNNQYLLESGLLIYFRVCVRVGEKDLFIFKGCAKNDFVLKI